jgi:hypothetical protein
MEFIIILRVNYLLLNFINNNILVISIEWIINIKNINLNSLV